MGTFSNSIRKILLSSPYVTKLTTKHVTYSEEFINLMLYGERNGLSRIEFFNQTLGVNCFEADYIDSCLNRWRNKPSLTDKSETRGRKKDLQKMSVEELKAENAYQREVIAHLKKIRGLTDSDL